VFVIVTNWSFPYIPLLYIKINITTVKGRFCGLVVRVLVYRSGGPVSIPGTNGFSKKKIK
jgi:hypothetical protein